MEELQTQLREHRGLLRHALLSTDALQKEGEELRRSNEYKIICQQLEAVKAASADESEQVLINTATNITDKIESTRAAISDREQVCHIRYRLYSSHLAYSLPSASRTTKANTSLSRLSSRNANRNLRRPVRSQKTRSKISPISREKTNSCRARGMI